MSQTRHARSQAAKNTFPASLRASVAAPLREVVFPIIAVVAILLSLLASSAFAKPGLSIGLGKPAVTDAQAKPVTVSGYALQSGVLPGGELAVAVVLDHAPTWKTWPSASQDVLPADIEEFAIRTAVWLDRSAQPAGVVGGAPELTAPQWVEAVGPAQWPATALAPNPLGGEPEQLEVLKGRAPVFVPILISPDAAPGSYTLPIAVYYQPCDPTTCLMPEVAVVDIAVTVTESGSAMPGSTLTEQQFEESQAFDPSIFASLRAGELDASSNSEASSATGSSFFGINFGNLSGPSGFLLLALAGVIGGIVLNLTPCVLPVIPIKVMTLTQHAGEHKSRALLLGVIMAVGVVAFWVGIGIPAALFSSFADPSRLFGIWWVSAGIGVIIVAMGLGIMGLFAINLPQQAYMINPKADSPSGSFMFGVMTGVLGLPCFGFVAGALLPAAAAFGAGVTMTIFTAIGVGMALPYLLLTAKPDLLKAVPRTGPASDLVKQVMGLLLLAAGVYFLGAGILALLGANPAQLASMPWWVKAVHWWLIAMLAIGAAVWLLVRTVQIGKKAAPIILSALFAIVIGGGGGLAAADRTHALSENFWLTFTPEVLEQAIEDDKVVLLDFTAEWCLNCKALEAAVLSKDPVRTQLTNGSVVPLMADLTSNSAPGWAMLREGLGQTGIPLIAVYGPGLDGPWLANAYTTEQVMQALERARGESAEGASGQAAAH